MIVITGGAGFIGSNLINFLFQKKNMSLATVDGKNKKNEDYFSSNKILKIDPKDLDNFLEQNKNKIEIIVHLGAVTSTVENNLDLIIKNNIDLSIFIWNWCTINKKRLVYASSAATYGSGINKFDDNESRKYLSNLFPLNPYGWSKHIFDKFVYTKKKQGFSPSQCVGLKFFNVFGPNEFHKNDMRSIILKIYQTVKRKSQVTLFKSHHPDYKNGEQLRDFIYVKDVVKVINWFIKNKEVNGLFNVGSGKPRSFNDIAKAVFLNCNFNSTIKYIDTPSSIRNQYQYYTKANISKLRKYGYKEKFTSLEEGISDYIRNYLNNE